MGTRRFQDTGGNASRKVSHEALRRALSILLTVAMTIEGMPPAAVAWALDDLTSGEASSTVVLGADETEGLEEGSAATVDGGGGETAGVSDAAMEPQAAPEPEPEPEPEHVAVVFDANVAEGDEHPAQGEMQPFDFVMDGEVHELTANAYAREGYTFEGWSLTPDGHDVKDNPKTEADESFKTLAIPDRLAMANLGYDEAVEDTDASGEVVSYHMVARNLEYAVRDGRITLYAQWAKVEEPKPEAQATQEEPADVKDDGASADDVAVVEVGFDETKADETKADETKADETKADETKADETKADETKADETKADETKAEDVTTDDEHGVEVEHEDVAAESEGDVSVSAVVSDDGPEAVLVEGELSGDDAVADVLTDDAGVGGAKARTMAKRLSAPLKMPVPAEDENVPRQLDGSFIENISVSWVTEDTVDNGDDALLYVKPEGDIPFRVRAILDYALSGEHDYEAGDVTITVPAKMFYNRDGSDAQTWVYPYAAEPSKSGDFMWSRVGDTIVFTNTHRLQAATKGYIEFDMSNLVPHKIVDMSTTEPFWARIEVATHLGNVIGLSSSEIEAQVDTEEQLTDAYKYTYDAPSIVRASDVPEAARIPGEENYVVVPWTMYGYVEGNTEFTLEIEDHKTDEYQGTIMYPSVTDRYQDSLFTGYKAGNDDGTQGAVLGTKKVQVVYPLSQFEPDVTYTFKNQVTYTLTEVDPAVGDDPQLVTQKVAAATRNWSWHLPTFKDPKGHFMVQKYGNDGQNGRKPYYSHYVYNRAYKYYDCDLWNHSSPYFGSYPSGLNDLRDGKSVELGYTLDSTGYLLPWTLEGDPRVASNYNKRNVTMVTTDTDETDARSIWFEGLDLELGRDYVYKAFEFPQMPRIYSARAVNLNPDGSFAALTAGDGTVDYQFDRDASHVPDITLEAKVSGVWQQIAVASWKTGNLVITPISSVIVDGSRVSLPAGTEQVRTSLTTNIAAVEYHVRPIIELKPSEAVMGVVEELFDGNSTPSGEVYNTTYMRAYDSDGNEIVDIHKKAYDELGGYSVDVAVQPTKTYRQVTVDPDRREVRVHYSASVYERSYIPEVSLWEEAVADGYLVPDTAGVFYDLLPLGMTPVLSSVSLRSDDRVVDAYKVENWRNTGRTMLIVEASLSPQPEEYDDDGHIRIEDVLRLNFDAVYPFESVVDYGKDVHNVIAYESFVREPLGTVDGLGAEADDPTTRNNVTTPQAFKTDDEILAMTGLDDSREGERFVYAGVTGTIDMPSAARTSLSKDIQVNNDGRWSQGTYEDKRTVYEGGTYSYRLRMMSDNNTISRDLVMYDSLENFYAAQGNDEVDIDAPRWRGELVGVDTLQLRMMGCAPVVYYSTVDELQLADESNPDAANDTNTNLDDRNIWVKASDYTGDLADVHAVAIDCRKRTDGTPFELTPLESATALIRMHAPHGEPAREYIAEDAHAYNNIYLKCTSVDKTTGIANGKNFVRHDYTKVGLEEFKIEATKVWDDDSDRDGVRPDEVTFQLIANGTDVVQAATATAPDWKATFENMPYTDENGQTIRYRVDEVVPEGYARSVSSDGNSFTITNKHVPETVHLTGAKTWVGGEDAIPVSITVRLYADGNLVATKQVKPAEDGSWSYDFGEMPKYRDQGTEIVYTVDETKVPAAWVPTYSETSLDIENTYHPFGDLVVTKNVVGATEAFSDRRFDVTVDLMGADGEALTDEFAYDTSDGRTGVITSGGSISLASGESATIHELPENTRYVVTESAPAGYTMSGKDLVGYVTANTDTTAAVTNTYLAKGFVNLEAEKQLTGRELRRYQFRFELMDENGELLRTASNKADGSVVFGAINYTQADVGEHRYQVVETVRDKAGYTYDERVYTAIVTVGDLGNGTLSVDTRYENAEGESVDVPLFENEYKAEGSVNLKAWKKLEGRALTDGEFSFELLDENGQRVGNVVTNNATGEIVFDEIKFDQDDAGKTFRFVAHEIPGDDATVNYSVEAYAYIVSVVDNGDGTLSFVQDASSASIGEPRPLRWDEVPEELRGDLIWYDSSSGEIDIYCSVDKLVGINESTGRPPYTHYTSAANEVAASVLSLAYGTPITSSDIRSAFNNQSESPTRYFSSGSVVDRLWDQLVITFPGMITLAENKGSDFAAQTYEIRFHSIETVSDQRMPYLRAFGTETVDVNIEDETGVMPVFTNTLKPGSLRVEKRVDGNVPEAHSGDEFRFKVKLTGDSVPENINYELVDLDAPTGTMMGDGGLLGKAWNFVMGLFEPRKAYAVSSGWTQVDGCEWHIDNGELVIRPVDNGSSGSLSQQSSWPWASQAATVTSVRVESGVSALNCATMFSGMTALTSVDLSGMDFSQCASMYCMFSDCSSLETVTGLAGKDMRMVQSMAAMFLNCSSLTAVDMAGCETSSKLLGIANMFAGCTSLGQVSLNGLYMGSVNSSGYMFDGTGSLILDASPYNGRKTVMPTSVGGMFINATASTINLSNADFSYTRSVGGMFNGANVGSVSFAGSEFSSSDLISLSGMFAYGCSVANVDFSNAKFPYVTHARATFDRVSELVSVDMRGADFHSLTATNNMFDGCKTIGDGFVVSLDSSTFSSVTQAQDMFNASDVGRVTAYYANFSSLSLANEMFENCDKLKTAYLDRANFSGITNMGDMFHGCDSLEEVSLNGTQINQCTTMGSMFEGCLKLKRVSMCGMDLGTVSNTSDMFKNAGLYSGYHNSKGHYGFVFIADQTRMPKFCSGMFRNSYVCDLELIGANFSVTESMYQMFSDCPSLCQFSLKSGRVPTYKDMNSVITADEMFARCSSLESVDFGGARLNSLSQAMAMFKSCASLKDVDMSMCELTSLKDMTRWFDSSDHLRNVNFSGAKFGSLENMSALFASKEILASVAFSGCDLSTVTNCGGMFSGNTGISGNLVPEFYAVKMPQNCDSMFVSSGISSVAFNGADFSHVTSMRTMFASSKISSIDFSNHDLSHVASIYAAFAGCSSLKDVSLRNTNILAADISNSNLGSLFASSGVSNGATCDLRGSGILTVPTGASIFAGSKFSEILVDNGFSFANTQLPDAPADDDNMGTWHYVEGNSYHTAEELMAETPGGGTYVWDGAPCYSVIYDANGGIGSDMSSAALVGKSVTIRKNGYKRYDYDFVSWNSEPDGSGTTYNPDDVVAFELGQNESITLYAQWKQRDHTINVEDGAFEVLIPAGHGFVVEGLPAGTAYSVFEESSDGWVLVSQSSTSGNIAPAETSVAEFTNRYDEVSTSITLGGTKTLDGRGAAEGAFTFELREDGQLIESVTNAAGGGISFSPIVYGEGDVGTHVYTIEEVSGNDSTIIYDTHTETVVVEVSLNGRNLSAVPTYDADGANFANTTLPGSIEISKETDGGGDPDQEFEFEVELKGVMGAVGTGDDGGSVLKWLVDGVRSLFSVRKAYAATGWSQWTDYGSSVEWRIDESGMLCIRPIEGNRGVLKWTPDDSSGYYPPWHNGYTSLHRQIRGLSIPAGKTIECQGSLYSMFSDSGVVTVDTRGLDTSKATSMDYMFTRCESLVAVPRLDYDNVQSAKDMFENCNLLTDVDMHGIEFPELINAEYMFAFCDNLRSVNWSGVSAPKLERMRYLFNQAGKLSSFDMSDSSFPSVEDVDYMLQNSGNDAGGDVYFNFSGVTWGPSMAHMAYIGQSKCHIDLTGADLTRVVNATGAFGYLYNGVEFKMPNVSMPNATDAGYMVISFGSSQTSDDVNIDIHGCDFGHADIRGLFSYAGTGYAGDYTNAGVLNCAGIGISDCTVDNSMFSECTFSLIDLSGVDLTNFSGNWLEGTGNRDGDTLLDIHDSKLPRSCYKFLKSNYITDIDMHDADTSSVTTMSYMFGNSQRLKSVNLSGIDTSYVTDMGNMFSGDRSLVELDLTSFDVSSLTEMWAMFQGCSSLETIYAKADADWPIDSTVDDERVFDGCTSLIGGDGTEFDQNVIGFEMARVDGLDGEPGYFTNGTGDTVVSFGANGGSIVVGESHVVMRNRVTDVSVPKVMRDGYVFVGWNTKADGTGVDYGTPNKVTPAQGRSLTLYAQWTPEGEAYSYKVVHRLEKADEPGSFEVTGRETRHAGSLNDVTVTPNSYYGFVKPAAQTVNIAEDGSTEVTFDYTRARITVTYVLDDGTTRTQTMMGGVRTPLDAAPAVAGKRFVGWLDGEHGENGFYADGQAVSLGADTTLYAHYVDEDAEDDYEGTSRVMHVRVKAGETVTIPNIPAGTVYEVREVNVPSGWEQVSIKGGTGTVGANSISVVSARNAYSSSGKFDIVAHKSLVGGELTEGAFSFELLDGSGRVIARSVNGGVDTAETIADAISGEAIANPNFGLGAVNFRDIQVSEPGTYTYTVREVAGRDADIVYDEHVETVTVVATDRGDGTIACNVTYDADGATFTNRVKPPEERTYEGLNGNLSVTKEVAQGPDGKMFTFDVEARDENGAPLNASFETRAYTGGTAMYTREGVWHTSNITDSGVKLGEVASSVWQYGTISVPGAESIHLEYDYTNPRGYFAVWAGDHTEQVARQSYTSSFNPDMADVYIGYASGQNKDNILLHGSADIDGDIATIGYQCYAYPQNNCPPDNGGYNEWTNYGCFVRATGEVEDDAYDQGSITFVDGHAMLEVVGGQKKDIVGLPAGATYRVTEQEMDGWQQISAEGTEGTIPEDATAEARFANSYFPEGSFNVRAKKVGVGLDITDGAYEFVMGGPGDEFVGRVRNDADGNVVFSDLAIEPEWAGTTRTYTISEIPGEDEGILWDTHAEKVKVSFADDGEGHLTANVAYDADGCVFTNERLIPMPGTGLGGIPFRMLGYGFAAVAIALSTIVVRRRRRDDRIA